MRFISSKYAFLIIGDLIIVFFSIHLATVIRSYSQYFSNLQNYIPFFFKAAIFSIFILFICFFVDLYNIEKIKNRKEMVIKIIMSSIITAIVIAVLSYFLSSIIIGRGVLFIALCIAAFFQCIWHLTHSFLAKLETIVKKVLILGTGPVANNIGNLLISANNGFSLAGYVNYVGEPMNVPKGLIICNGDGLFATATKERVHKIVVSLHERRGTFPIREVLDCKLRGIDVVDAPSFYEQMTGKLPIENMNPSHIIFSDGFRVTVFRRYIKRAYDLLIALIGLVLSMPVMVILPILIKLESKGPVFFKQERVGEGEKNFTLYKFRTMVDGAETDSGPVWSQSGDKRITKLGKILRKTRIDELPQLLNVLYGDMSFIGPRPERGFFVESLKKNIPYYSERHCVKPGITGWAQVRYEYGDSIDDAIEKLKYDLYYVKYQSITLDMLIILDTIKVVLLGRGGR